MNNNFVDPNENEEVAIETIGEPDLTEGGTPEGAIEESES